MVCDGLGSEGQLSETVGETLTRCEQIDSTRDEDLLERSGAWGGLDRGRGRPIDAEHRSGDRAGVVGGEEADGVTDLA